MIRLENHPDGVIVRVRVSAGASCDRVIGEHAGALKLSVSAAPERGKANKAVCELVAKTLGIAKSRVRVIAGVTSRDKKLLITGVGARAVGALLSSGT